MRARIKRLKILEYTNGFKDGKKEGYREGYKKGREESYEKGYRAGRSVMTKQNKKK